MSHYLIAHLNEGRCGNAQILSGAGIDELHRGAAEASEMGVHLGKYAMGWFDGNIGRTRILWHTGTVPTLPICLRARGMLRFMMLFMPDMSWIALICGGFSRIWAFLRTGLILRTLK